MFEIYQIWAQEISAVHQSIDESEDISAVIGVAGSWEVGDIASSNLIDSVEQMWKKNLQSAITGAFIECNLIHFFCCCYPTTDLDR